MCPPATRVKMAVYFWWDGQTHVSHVSHVQGAVDSRKRGKTMTETEKRLEEMEQMGVVEKTGEYRDGKPLWRLTDYARQLDDEHPEALDALYARGPVFNA